MAVLNNLYPPILPDSCPAFLRIGACDIYFSLSIYNSVTDIKHVQVSLTNQSTNLSALNSEKWPTGIMFTTLNYNPNGPENYKYSVTISPDDLEEGEFGINQFYKVQIRFGSCLAPKATQVANWLYNNTSFFSEWSKVCLIKGIDPPIISIHDFDNDGSVQQTVLPTSLIEIVGNLSYNNKDETEYLTKYNIKIYQEEDLNTPLFDSGQIYSNPYNPNEFNYVINYNLSDSTPYVMSLTYTTNNLYTDTNNYKFIVLQYGTIDRLDATLTATVDNQNGRIKVHLLSNTDDVFMGNFTIRRTSSESDFHIWEDIKTVAYINGTKLDYEWYDNTIQSGVWYKYCAQKRNSMGTRGPIIQIKDPVMCLLDDIFLTKNNCQLKIKFNPTVSDFKYNVTESQQVTIGAKYPYIKRNGNNYFRTFSIGGLISSFMDTTDWYDPHFEEKDNNDPSNVFEQSDFNKNKNEIKAFTSKSNIYGNHKELYDNYNQENNINEYNDYIYEREFREKVYDFLYKNDVKLFRSTTEGNILIKLMNIAFQPMESLGRRFYSFTASAIQIDEANISNYNKYNINIIGDYQKEIVFSHETTNFLNETFSSQDGNIINKISKQYSLRAVEGFVNKVRELKTLKLEIDSDPYVIIEKNGKLKKAEAGDQIEKGKSTIGYIVSINEKEMIIPPYMSRKSKNIGYDENNENTTITEIEHLGFFELKEPNTLITNLSFPQPTKVSISYTALLEEAEDTSKLVNRYYYYYKPGQLYGTFNPNQSLIRKIYNKYLMNYEDYYQRLVDITGIKVEGPLGTILYVKDSEDTNFNRHILGEGYLQLYDEDSLIEGLYFGGVHLLECKNPSEIFSINGITEFTLQDGLYDSLSDIKEKNNGNIENGNMYQVAAYGFKENDLFFEDHKILVIDENLNLVQWETNGENLEKIYTLKLDTIDDNETLRFVYYYGCWYLLPKTLEITKLLKADIRGVRDNEYILTNQTYQSFDEIQHPIKNGVYHITPLVVADEQAEFEEENPNTLNVNQDSVYLQADEDYSLFMKQIFDDSENNYIYYHNNWYPFINGDVLCPIDGIVDYYAEIMKGVYRKYDI